VKRAIPDAKLMIIGKPTFLEYYEELKNLSDDSVIFIDYVPNEKLPEYYAACDIYATCSYWENHNLPVLEAKMCGKPVVAFDIPAFREEVSETDILVEKGNVDQFGKACINLLLAVHEGKYEDMHN
jgi:1,2-diacylglycerol 3-alpha-glucosyltransferase